MTLSSLCAKDVATDGRLSGLVSVNDVLLLLAATFNDEFPT